MPPADEAASKIFRAYHLTEGLKLPSILGLFPQKPFRVSATELVYRYGLNSYLTIYNFGSMACFNVPKEEEEQALSILRQFVSPKDGIVTSEEYFLEEGSKPQVEFRKVVLDKITFEKVQIVSLVLAQSTALEYFETIANDLLAKSGQISEILEREGKIGRKGPNLIKFIGFCLNTKQKIIASTYLLDSPDPTWESQTLELLYRQMIENFEIRDRYRTLEYKLRIVQDSVEVLSDLTNTRRMYYLEIAIVAMIGIEIVLFVFELLRRG
ncbi:MAG: RMD1 family protein [Pseudomonadota bacterium]